MSLTQNRDRLQEVIDDIYEDKKKLTLRPMFPYILVRVLPRHRMHGSIYLPQDNNKVLLEGVVLAAFKPFWRRVKPQGREDFLVLEEPEVRRGDIVLFQSFEGIPVEHVIFGLPFFKNKDYMLVSADPVGNGRNGLIAVLEGIPDVEEELTKTIKQHLLQRVVRAKQIVEALKEKFVISLADQTSKTQSGKSRKD